MSRLKEVQSFIEYDLKKNMVIEPGIRHEAITERLLDVMNSYNPKVVVKAGIGHGDILLDIAKKSSAYIVVVEPSFSAIENFLKKHDQDPDVQKLRFINGDFHDFPVDYYASDFLICIDYLDFFDSGKSINEFKRALQFEGIFFLATVVLNNSDIDGVYDDFIRMIFPLHNDYYITEDVTTLLELKDFRIIKNMQLKFKNDLLSQIEYFQDLYKSNIKENALEFVKAHREEFVNFFNMNNDYEISEPYYIGLYERKKITN